LGWSDGLREFDLRQEALFLQKLKEFALPVSAPTKLATVESGSAAFDCFGFILALLNIQGGSIDARLKDSHASTKKARWPIQVIKRYQRPSKRRGAKIDSENVLLGVSRNWKHDTTLT
jgi:hypothetical protein